MCPGGKENGQQCVPVISPWCPSTPMGPNLLTHRLYAIRTSLEGQWDKGIGTEWASAEIIFNTSTRCQCCQGGDLHEAERREQLHKVVLTSIHALCVCDPRPHIPPPTH